MSAPIYLVRAGVIPAIVPSAPITAAHRKIATDLCRNATGSNRALHHVPKFAQLIADSEARACDQLRAEVATLREVAKDENCPHKYYTKGGVVYGVHGTSSITYVDQLRAEVEALKQSVESGQRVLREDAERNAARAERAEAEIKDRAAVMRDVMRERDAAEAELAVERARLDWLEKRGPWESWNGFGETGITLRENIRAAIDAAMKKGAL